MNQMNSGNLGWATVKQHLIFKKWASRLFSSDFDRFIELEKTVDKKH